MYRIPRVVQYREDELLVSWVIRLAKANCFDDYRRFIYAYFYPNRPKYSFAGLKMDFRDILYHFWRALPAGSIDAAELLLNLTVFPGIAPFLSKEQRQRYLCQCFHTDSGKEDLFPTPHGFNHSLTVCPDCMEKELSEYGSYHFHRAHQMPGVTVCHIHGTPLLALGRIPAALDSIPDAKPLPDNAPEGAIGYALFCRDFLDAGFDFSSDTVAALLKAVLPDKGRLSAMIMDRVEKSGFRDADLSQASLGKLQISIVRRGAYLDPGKFLKLMYVLYGSVEAIKEQLPQSSFDEEFVSFAEKSGYSVGAVRRNDVVTLIHKDCGMPFVVSPYGFRIGWRCPVCTRAVSVQQQFETLVSGAGDGEYEAVGKFSNMDENVEFRHLKCGKTFTTKARAFIYEGVRCDCEYTLGYEGVKANIEKHRGFRLAEYTAIDKPLTIEHTKCGSRFRFYYTKFMAAPRCRVCERKGHINKRTDDDFRADIRDLTGDEYELAGPYANPRTKVLIRHNRCGTIQAYKPYYFLDGARCSLCTSRQVSEDAFIGYVDQISSGRYGITAKPTGNLYEITDSETGSVLRMSRNRILQELRRPTPSEILPLDHKPELVALNNLHDSLMEQIRLIYPEGGPVFAEDVSRVTGIDSDKGPPLYNSLISGGLLFRICPGVYGFPGETYDADKVIAARYLVRRGHHIGYQRGPGYAYEIGLGEKPVEWHIASNMESAKTTNRKTFFMGKAIHIRGSRFEITDGNWLILSALDFLIQYRQVTDQPEDAVIDHVRRYIQGNNGGRLPEYGDFAVYMDYRTRNIHTMMNRIIRRLTDAGTA